MTRRYRHARPKIIGARIKRIEDPRLLTGRGAYTDDRQIARVLACRVPPQRSVACAHPRHRLRRRARGAGHRRGVHRGGFDRRAQAAHRHLAHAELSRHARSSRWRSARCAMSASRWSAWWRKAAIRPRTRSNSSRSITSRCRSSSIPSRLFESDAPLLHEEAGTNVLVSREFKRGDVEAGFRRRAGAGRRPLPHAPQDAGRDRAARLRRRIRRHARRADAALGHASTRHCPRCARHRARSCRASRYA